MKLSLAFMHNDEQGLESIPLVHTENVFSQMNTQITVSVLFVRCDALLILIVLDWQSISSSLLFSKWMATMMKKKSDPSMSTSRKCFAMFLDPPVAQQVRNQLIHSPLVSHLLREYSHTVVMVAEFEHLPPMLLTCKATSFSLAYAPHLADGNLQHLILFEMCAGTLILSSMFPLLKSLCRES